MKEMKNKTNNITEKEKLKKIKEQTTKVYVPTPPEIIDFIENSVQHILKTEFNTDLNDESIHIIDPFCGEGQFSLRALQNGTMTPDTVSRIEHIEISASRAKSAKQKLDAATGKNCTVKNEDAFGEGVYR